MAQELINNKISKLLELKKSSELVTYWTKNSMQLRLNNSKNDEKLPTEHSELLAYMYQGAGLKIEGNSINESRKLLSKSYDIWKVIWYSIKDKDDKPCEYIKQLFHLVSTGLLSDSFAEVRMVLMESDLKEYYAKIPRDKWPNYLEHSIYLIILILIRKGSGWDDIKLVDNIIEEIQDVQRNIEEQYLLTLEQEELYAAICWIGALFNILEAIENYKKYMLSGKPENIEKVILRYCRDSYEMLEQTSRQDAKFLFILIEKVLLKMVSMSIWSSISGVSATIDKYVDILTMSTNNKPIFELWPSQQQAIANNLFDNTKTAIVVQMPTSAGKTLLSKFYILQTLNLYAESKIAYIVPTRALVNQVKRDLKRDFKDLDIKVDVSIPYSDIEEIEDKLLLQKSDIIVTTPEKLDILMRVKHPIINKLRLVVVDEAHGLQEKDRGAKLELLLAMLRKENRNLRILMLSPFIDNAKDISQWLGASRGHEIYVDWKPSQQFTGVYQLKTIRRGKHEGKVTYLPSSMNTMYNSEFDIFIHECSNKDLTKTQKSFEVAKIYNKIGGVLILCTTRKIAEDVAKQFLVREDIDETLQIRLSNLLKLIEEEMGVDCLLYKCVKKGCAYHHSSLPLIIREEIEEAIANQCIDIVAATTTLAQGMNFPISTVIFQGMSMSEGRYSRPMNPSEFWNIAGRAGRALVDKEGHIVAICNDEGDRLKFESYLKNKNQEVMSSLLKMINEVPEDGFNMYWIKRCKELSALLQYIYHIILVDPDIEIDDLLRGSLVFHQLESTGNSASSEKLLKLTRNYLKSIEQDKKKKKLMESIDKTGLSSISMHYLLGVLSKYTEIELNDDKIFQYEDTNLEKAIEIINNIPEINLGLYEGNSGFNPSLVAKITKDWVNGKSIREIADNNIDYNEDIKTIDDKMSHCGKYIYGKLINNLPWGVSAMQRAKGTIGTSKGENDLDEMLIPSYIYFGVTSKEAVAFSMLGVPRFAAESLGENWRHNHGNVSLDNLNKLEEWLKIVDRDQWVQCFKEKDREKALVSYSIWKKQNY